MADEFGDARFEELGFLSRLARSAGLPVDCDVLNPGPRRDMIALLVHEGYVNDLNISWRHGDVQGFGTLPGESALERQLHAARMETLSRVLGGQPTNVQISHRGRVRLSELRQDLQRNRIREGFGILWDKRHLETDLRIALMQASAISSLSVVFMDMNGLKGINDGINHDAGDAAIKAYFQLAESMLGSRGDVYCAGGDEVVAILPACDQNHVVALVRGFCQALMREQVRFQDRKLSTLTVSAGTATATDPTMSAATIRQQADEAMYRAKERASGEEPRPSSIASHASTVIVIIPAPEEGV